MCFLFDAFSDHEGDEHVEMPFLFDAGLISTFTAAQGVLPRDREGSTLPPWRFRGPDAGGTGARLAWGITRGVSKYLRSTHRAPNFEPHPRHNHSLALSLMGGRFKYGEALPTGKHARVHP